MKPVLIGIHNPVSTQPGYELYPLPVGCTGHRIWQMLAGFDPGITQRGYRDTFDRRNLCVGVISKRAAREAAERIRAELYGSGRSVVLLGRDVQNAFGVQPSAPAAAQTTVERITWYQVPHPSGRNHWYNDPENRRLVSGLLGKLYAGYHARG